MMGEKRPDFGDYVRIEMKRHFGPNVFYLHKVIGRLRSSHAATVPIDHGLDTGTGTDPIQLGGGMHDVLRVVQCGVDEERIFLVAEKDVILSNNNLIFSRGQS